MRKIIIVSAALFCQTIAAHAEFTGPIKVTNRMGAHEFKYVIMCPDPQSTLKGLHLAIDNNNLRAALKLGCTSIPLNGTVMADCSSFDSSTGLVKIKFGKKIGYAGIEQIEGCRQE